MAILTALKNAFAGLSGFLGVIDSAAAGLLGVGTGHTGGIVGSRFIGSGNAASRVAPILQGSILSFKMGSWACVPARFRPF